MAALFGQFNSSYPAGITGSSRANNASACASPIVATNAALVAADQSSATSPGAVLMLTVVRSFPTTLS
jgi:hypothetical protein